MALISTISSVISICTKYSKKGWYSYYSSSKLSEMGCNKKCRIIYRILKNSCNICNSNYCNCFNFIFDSKNNKDTLEVETTDTLVFATTGIFSAIIVILAIVLSSILKVSFGDISDIFSLLYF